MAKHDKYAPDQGRVKFRIVEVEVEGSSAAILEGMKNLTAALSRGNGSATLKQVGSNGHVVAALGSGDDIPEIDADVDEYEAPTPAAAPRKSTPRKVSPLNVVDIDFNAGKVKLKDFVAGLELESGAKKFTAIAVWFKEHGPHQEFTVHEVFTAMKHLNWTADMPNNPSTTLKDLRSKQTYKWLNSGSQRGSYIANHLGEKKVAEWRKS